MYDDWIDRIAFGLIGLIGLLMTGLVVLLFYMGGFWVGLYGVSCSIEPSQPHCVKAGWGTHNDVTLRAKP